MTIKPATPEEEAALLSGSSEETPTKTNNRPGLPDWVQVPEGFTFPKNREVAFMRFKAAWTDARDKGDRVIILWNLSANDEKLALKRSEGESVRVLGELARQMIRAYDGKAVDWSQGSFEMDRFWNELGAKCRQQVINFYTKTHSFTEEETMDFFTDCLSVVTTGLYRVSNHGK